MRLILYSTDDHRQNRSVDRHLERMLRREHPVLVYVPDSLNEPKSFYEEWLAHYKRVFPRGDFLYFPLKRRSPARLSKRVFSANFIYFSGGNTYRFLTNMKQSGFEKSFRQFLKCGGILGGCSAGGILMTPNISTAAVPSFSADANTPRLKDFRALNLTGFEFSPHYAPDPDSDGELSAYSRLIPRPIYGVTDGGGLVVSGKRLIFVGSVVRFQGGTKTRVQSRWTKHVVPKFV